MNATVMTMPPRYLWRSTGAILAGMVVVVALSEGTDMVLRLAHVLPPTSKPMDGPELYGLTLSYRWLYNVLAAIVTATLAPRDVARHLVVFAAIGFVLGMLGGVVNYLYHLGPRGIRFCSR